MLKQEEIKQIIEIGKEYKYKELCNILNETYTEATNKKTEQLENWERFFNYERIDKRTFKINNIYDVPMKGIEDGFFYKTMVIPVKCSKNDYAYLLQCREWAGQCWNELVKAESSFYGDSFCVVFVISYRVITTLFLM